MSKIRVDGRTMALSHPTRLAMYEELLNAEEMSTVMLQKKTVLQSLVAVQVVLLFLQMSIQLFNQGLMLPWLMILS